MNIEFERKYGNQLKSELGSLSRNLLGVHLSGLPREQLLLYIFGYLVFQLHSQLRNKLSIQLWESINEH